MIFNAIKNVFKKEDKPTIEYSKYFPNKFYTNKLVTIDDSLGLFLSNSKINLPKDPLIVKKITQYTSSCADLFEEIEFISSQYKLLYDSTEEIFYLLKCVHTSDDTGIINEENVIIHNEIGYKSWTGILELKNKQESKLISIYNREISIEADEYFFVEVNKQFIETRYIGIIVQPTMVD